MILAATYVLIQAMDGGWIARTTALISTALLMLIPVNPIILIGAGTACFVGLHTLALI